MKITLDISAMSEPLNKQLEKYSLKLEKVEKYEKIKKSFVMLFFHNYITEKKYDQCRKKLFDGIIKDSVEI